MFYRVRTINKRRYLYEERRYREGGKVRSISRSLGPVDGKFEPGLRYIEELMQKYPVDQFGNRIEKSAPVGAPSVMPASEQPRSTVEVATSTEAAPGQDPDTQ